MNDSRKRKFTLPVRELTYFTGEELEELADEFFSPSLSHKTYFYSGDTKFNVITCNSSDLYIIIEMWPDFITFLKEASTQDFEMSYE